MQQVSEEGVIPKPGSARAQRDHERPRLLQLLQDPLPVGASRQQIGQLAADPLQYRGPQQQPPNRFGLPIQHLGQQVLGHRPLGAGELFGEPPRIGVPGQRKRRQPQSCRPTLGPLR